MGISQQIGASSLSKPGVCTSSTRPATPYEGQMIYETDTDLVYLYNGTAWVEIVSALTKAPRGVVGVQTLTTAFATSATHTTMQANGMTLTITEISGRRYKITAFSNPYPNGGIQEVDIALLRNAVQIKQGNFASNVMNTGIALPIVLTHIYTSVASGSATYTVNIKAGTANTAVSDYGDGTFPRQFIIEDIGAA